MQQAAACNVRKHKAKRQLLFGQKISMDVACARAHAARAAAAHAAAVHVNNLRPVSLLLLQIMTDQMASLHW
jgi:CxxC motif-containing protein (DUF1111 family)